MDDKEESGLARQTQQFAAQQGLAIPLDNLARTRHLVADHLSYLMGTFYDNHRIFRITETNPQTGKKFDREYEVNTFDPNTQQWGNDLTEGDYDVVVTETPLQVTFENSQFEQALELRKQGIHIPDNVLIKHSNLADKNEILDQLEHQEPPPPTPGPLPPGASGASPLPGGVPVKKNTSPTFPAKPASPAQGLNEGIEGAGEP